jgi:hypothetical protein
MAMAAIIATSAKACDRAGRRSATHSAAKAARIANTAAITVMCRAPSG